MLNKVENGLTPGALTIYTENLEILVRKGNRTYHSIWDISEIIGYQIYQCTFSFPFELSNIDSNTFSDLPILCLEKLQHWIFTPKISTRMDGVNGKRPRSNMALMEFDFPGERSPQKDFASDQHFNILNEVIFRVKWGLSPNSQVWNYTVFTGYLHGHTAH